MTLALILGGVAALYMLWLLFRLAAHALPIYAGASVAVLLQSGAGYPVAIASGLGAGLFVWLAGRILFGLVRSPFPRSLLALSFLAPAASAGYQAGQALSSLMTETETVQTSAALSGAIAAAAMAWRGLAGTVSKPRLAQSLYVAETPRADPGEF
jgi:hypothetical protein